MENKKTKIISMIAIIALVLTVVTATYAYFQAQTGEGSQTDVKITANTVDTLSFETEKNMTADGLDRSMLIASAGLMSTFNRSKQEYVLNTQSKKIHLPDCASVDKMKEKNKAYSSKTIEELEAQGYTCGNCRPDLQKG